MWKSSRYAVILGALGLGVLACTVGNDPGGASSGGTSSGGTSSGGTSSGGTAIPQKQAQITSPTSGLQITATIASVTLGDECGSSGLAPAQGDCAEDPDASAGGAAKGGCGGSYCQQSNMQLSFTAGSGTQSARVEIVTVALIDSASGKTVDTLKASKPQAWSGNGYIAWDETIKPAGDLKASYDLSAPAWSTLSGTDSRGTSSYSTKYKLNVTLRIDGVEVVLESTDLSREPAVAT